MVYPSLLTVAAAALTFIGTAASVPLDERINAMSPKARDVLKRATPAAPHFVVYSDKYESSPPPVSAINGYNVFALSFLLAYGAADNAQVWEEMDASDRTTILDEYHAAGISLIVSLFGSSETPTSSGYDPITTADTMAAWVIEYGLDGVDVDYEDFTAFDAGTGAAEQWLGNFTTELRTKLPQGNYILTHAPVAPWFSPNMWSGGGYLWVNEKVGDMIDWYNIQFYNQGETEYTNCTGLLDESSSTWPESALFQIAASGVTLDKLVIGKPGTTADANNGYIAPANLATCVADAYAKDWNAGVMVWQYPDAGASWISTVRGNTWPVTPAPTTTTTATGTSASPTSTAPAGSQDCAGVSAWDSSTAYNGGSQVTYGGFLWTADYWNQDSVPGGTADVWTSDGACASNGAIAAVPLMPVVTQAPARRF